MAPAHSGVVQPRAPISRLPPDDQVAWFDLEGLPMAGPDLTSSTASEAEDLPFVCGSSLPSLEKEEFACAHRYSAAVLQDSPGLDPAVHPRARAAGQIGQ
jgi:hypothetical protein